MPAGQAATKNPYRRKTKMAYTQNIRRRSVTQQALDPLPLPVNCPPLIQLAFYYLCIARFDVYSKQVSGSTGANMSLPIVMFLPKGTKDTSESKRDEELQLSNIRSHAASIGFRRRVTGESFTPSKPAAAPANMRARCLHQCKNPRHCSNCLKTRDRTRRVFVQSRPALVGGNDPFASHMGHDVPILGLKALDYG